MPYRNQYDHTGQNSKNGARAEKLFESLVEQAGGYTVPSTLAEQFKGIDFHVYLNGKVDVKAFRRNRDGDDSPDAKKVWLELKNVQGRKGWVYNEADYIAFERRKEFVVVRRVALCELIDNLVDMDDYVLSPDECMYNLYSRIGRNDLLTKVHIDDIRMCAHYTIPKPDENSIN